MKITLGLIHVFFLAMLFMAAVAFVLPIVLLFLPRPQHPQFLLLPLGALILLLLLITHYLTRRLRAEFDGFLAGFEKAAHGGPPMDPEPLLFHEFRTLANLTRKTAEKRDEAETILRSSQYRFFALFDQSPLSMQLFSPEGYLRLANPAFERTFGVNADDLLLANYNIFQDRQYAAGDTLLQARRGFSREFVVLPEALVRSAAGGAQNAKTLWLKGYIWPIRDNDGRIIEVALVHEDITDQKKAENALRALNKDLERRVKRRTAELETLNRQLISAKEAAEAATRAKSEFLANMSHELRTPLAAIKESFAMLLEGAYAGQPDKEKQLMTIASEEIERLIGAVGRIMDVSGMEAGMIDYHFRDAPLLPVIRKSILKLAPMARRKQISLELKPPPQLPLVRMDEDRLGQVMQNLIGNALKFCDPKGSVTLRLGLVPGQPEFVLVSVEDTGRGIAPNDLQVIFEKFKRIDDGRETVSGTGLGLYITKYIVTAHGGKIWAKSRPGEGSTFYFTLKTAQDGTPIT